MRFSQGGGISGFTLLMWGSLNYVCEDDLVMGNWLFLVILTHLLLKRKQNKQPNKQTNLGKNISSTMIMKKTLCLKTGLVFEIGKIVSTIT